MTREAESGPLSDCIQGFPGVGSGVRGVMSVSVSVREMCDRFWKNEKLANYCAEDNGRQCENVKSLSR